MRSSLARLVDEVRPESGWHFGLVHERVLLFDGDDLGDARAKDEWLRRLEQTTINSDYADFIARWRAGLDHPGARLRVCKAASRLLIGHGNPSGSEVGLTVHHTWGVPVIPGSALKGLLAHYVSNHYGAGADDDDPRRDAWRGVSWDRKRMVGGPGDCYRALFGAPDVDDDPSRACAGSVVFHDALHLPESDAARPERPFVRDALTIHQKRYYDSGGKVEPSDHDDPIPIGFLTVRPGMRFLLAVEGPADWAELAMSLLLDALDEWGIGGKTSLGYGRLVADEEPIRTIIGVEQRASAQPKAGVNRAEASELLREFLAAIKHQEGATNRETLEAVLLDWPARLAVLGDHERAQAGQQLKSRAGKLKKPGDAALKARLQAWAKQLCGE